MASKPEKYEIDPSLMAMPKELRDRAADESEAAKTAFERDDHMAGACAMARNNVYLVVAAILDGRLPMADGG